MRSPGLITGAVRSGWHGAGKSATTTSALGFSCCCIFCWIGCFDSERPGVPKILGLLCVGTHGTLEILGIDLPVGDRWTVLYRREFDFVNLSFGRVLGMGLGFGGRLGVVIVNVDVVSSDGFGKELSMAVGIDVYHPEAEPLVDADVLYEV